ncbi:hypothetical protein [Yanghanlia caeni]|uniref:Lipoprotein n=1 Tax=Yanghanlia caeni TaxID=3064283 RepID=A0ABU1D412_9BURK|nr:hypothetical protein [Alcaligenaceae bacterium LG-2]NGR08296.1 hypothetical protein [bacterium SGD-2]HZH57065.1 hypothetical protein [Burkholderiaceae bacterium]
MRQVIPYSRQVFALTLLAALAGCAGLQPEGPAAPPDTTCKAAAPGDALTGNWLSVRREKGVAGELRTFFALQPDGTMRYAEQLRRPGHPPQGLAETGCWHREGATLVLRTVESNGSPVDLDDPIYVNRYQITRESGERLRLAAPDGVQLDARRMPPDFRLAW